MGVDPNVLAGIEAALQADPGNEPLRLHYADLLSQAGRPGDSLEQAQVLLASHPAWVEALRVAHRAAHEGGNDELALGYRRLLGSLGDAPGPLGTPTKLDPTRAGTASEQAGPPPLPGAPGPDTGEVPDDASALFATSVGDLDEPVGDPDLEQPTVTLADVAGMDDVKRRLELSFLGPARDPALRKAFGKSLRGGLLLYGPPGCGKTFIARALAGELRANFFGIGISDVLDMWVGSSERNLHDLFEQARRNTPCVLFLDELDAIGMKRSNLRNAAAMRSTVNQLLTELDGALSDNEGLFVLGATNQPWEIDAALRRPGRFDRMLLVLPPDRDARRAILESNLRNRPVEERLDLTPLVAATEGWSGADVAHLCETAAEAALERSMQAGAVLPITPTDLRDALRQLRSTTGAWFDVASNVATFANEGGDYDDLLAFLRQRRKR